MTQFPADPIRPPRFKKTRAAALGFGLGATLALSPLVWAQNPPANNSTTPTTTPSVAIPQQSFAPLVNRLRSTAISRPTRSACAHPARSAIPGFPLSVVEVCSWRSTTPLS